MGEVQSARLSCQVVANRSLTEGVFELILSCSEIVERVRPGQFVNLYCHHAGRLLPRPISVCEVNGQRGELHLVFAVVGQGTAEFAQYHPGEKVEVLGPLGNGFPVEAAEEYLIVGGGVGTPPLVELYRQLEGKMKIVVGFRSTPYLVDRLEQLGEVHVATDDGSSGFHGNVVELMEKESMRGRIYACGPGPMLKGVQSFAAAHGLRASLSMEERMGCGFGGCVGCAVKVKADNEHGCVYKKVCKDGPVFSAEEVLFP